MVTGVSYEQGAQWLAAAVLLNAVDNYLRFRQQRYTKRLPVKLPQVEEFLFASDSIWHQLAGYGCRRIARLKTADLAQVEQKLKAVSALLGKPRGE